MGTVSVTGGMDGSTRVKVTKGTTVTLNATPTDSNKYRFIGWYSDPEFKAPVTLSNGAYPANDTSAEHKFYAKFQRQYKVEAKAVSDGAVANSTGGTVKISGGEAGAYTVGSYLEGQDTSITATPKEAMTSRVGILTRIAQNWKVRILRFQLRIFRQIICIMPNL